MQLQWLRTFVAAENPDRARLLSQTIWLSHNVLKKKI